MSRARHVIPKEKDVDKKARAARNATAIACLVGLAYGLPTGRWLINPYRNIERLWLDPSNNSVVGLQIESWPEYLAYNARKCKPWNMRFGMIYFTIPILAAFSVGLRVGRKIESVPEEESKGAAAG
jgi:hypothetical protein